MKFAIAAVFTLALAMGVQTSWIPWAGHHTEVAGHGLSYTAVSSPVHVAHAVHVAHHAPAAIAIHESPAVWHGDWHGAWDHGHHAAAVVVDAHHAHGPALVVDAHHAHHAVPIVHHAHEGEYIAKTRGAVHAAPLAGHAASVASINLQPAPGTV